MHIDKSNWVCADKTCESPIIKMRFYAKDPDSAILEICGLGFYEAFINEKNISCDMFKPAWSDYEPRENIRLLYPLDCSFSHRIYYNEYDVSSLINSGENELIVHLGNGWYNQHVRNIEGDLWYGLPKLRFALILKDKDGQQNVIYSDDSLKWKPSHVIFNNIYFGETQDMNLLFEEEYLKSVCLLPDKGIKMQLQNTPCDRVIRKLEPTLIYSDIEKSIYDIGINASGRAVLKTSAKKGEEIIVRYSEELSPEKKLDFASAGQEQQQSDKYIANGIPDTLLKPVFALHCGRYLEVSKNAEAVYFEEIHADIDITSSFSCSNEIINRFYDTYVHTQLTNIHYSVPSDCPHRERLGYTGDGHLTANAALFCLDSESLYEKWVADIADCQCTKTGRVQHTAPFYGGGGGPAGWGCAIVHVPYVLFKHCGREDIAKKYYKNMLFWFDYLDTLCENDLIVRAEKGGWCLGDWCTLEKVALPEPFVNNYYYARSLDEAIEISRYFGFGDEEKLGKRKNELLAAMKNAYYDSTAGSFCGGIQGADAFAADIGIADERTLTNLINKYELLGHFDTGIFGTDILIKVLFENGYGDLAVKLLSSFEPGSYGYMFEKGATTLWECWDGANSHCHPMFGSPAKYLFSELLGIKQEKSSIGFDMPIIKPDFSCGLDFAKGHTKTKFGDISVTWKKGNGRIYISVYMPTEGRFKANDSFVQLKKGKNDFYL